MGEQERRFEADLNSIVEIQQVEWLLETPDALSDSSSSSSSGDFTCRDRIESISKMTNFIEQTVPLYSDLVFQQHFRLSRATAYNLIERFNHSDFRCKSTNTMGSTSEKTILLCLWYLANTESFRQISDRFNVSLSTAHSLLVKGVMFILTLRREFIKWPTREQKIYISQQFQRKQDFRGVIGCIDGSHIKINKPQEHEEVYVNRKGFHSILIQGICDHRKLFLDVYCGEPGSIHDARLLRKSSIYLRSENPDTFNEYYLLADSAYPSLPWLIPPFRDNGFLIEKQKQFNQRLSSTRIVIEHTFGLLKGRFRRLDHFENLSIDLIVQCIMATCVLHNICIINNDLMEDLIEHVEVDNEDIQREDDINIEFPAGRDMRNELFEEMFRL